MPFGKTGKPGPRRALTPKRLPQKQPKAAPKAKPGAASESWLKGLPTKPTAQPGAAYADSKSTDSNSWPTTFDVLKKKFGIAGARPEPSQPAPQAAKLEPTQDSTPTHQAHVAKTSVPEAPERNWVQRALPTDKEWILRDVAEKFPKGFVDPASMPETFKHLRENNHQLVVAALKFHADKFPGIDENFYSELRFLHDSTPNAFAGVISDPDTGIIKGEITFVSTGLLGLFLHSKEPAHLTFEQRLLAVAGVIAHEVAHSIDKADPHGIEVRLGNSAGASAALELRTDLEGNRLNHWAGIAPAANTYAQEILLADHTTLDRIRSFASSHPEVTFRNAYNRGFATVQRMNAGLPASPRVPTETLEAIRSETRDFGHGFKAPKNIEELDSILASVPEQLNEAEFNAVVLWFDHQLAMNPQLDPSDPMLNNVRRAIMRYNKKLATTSEELEKLLADADIHGLGVDVARPHHEYVASLPFYNHPGLLEGKNPVITQSLNGSGWTSLIKDWAPYLDGTMRVHSRATQKSVFEEYFDFTRVNVIDHDLSHGFSRDLVLKHIMRPGRTSSEREGELAFLVEKPALARWLAEPLPTDFIAYNTELHGEVDKMLSNANLLDTESPLYHFDYKYALPSKESTGFWKRLLDTPSTRAGAQALLQKIWKQRGMWASLEFLSNKDFNIDWGFVGEAAGVPESQLHPSILKEFESYFSKLMSSAVAQGDFTQGHPQKPKTRPAWLTVNTEQFLTKKIETLSAAAPKADMRYSVMSRFYLLHPDLLSQRVAERFDALVAERQFTELRDIHNTWRDAMSDVVGVEELNFFHGQVDRVGPTLSILRKRGVSPELQRKFLNDGIRWLGQYQTRNVNAIYDEAVRTGVVKDLPDFYQRVAKSILNDSLKTISRTNALENAENLKRIAVRRTSDRLVAEVGTLGKLSDAAVVDYLERLSGSMTHVLAEESAHWEFMKPNVHGKSKEIADKIVADLEGRQLSTVDNLRAFTALTNFTSNAKTDHFFRTRVLPGLEAATDTKAVRQALLERRIRSGALEMDLVKLVQKHELPADATAEDIIRDMIAMAPADSNARDQFLEDLAWAKDVSGERLKHIIEGTKSGNWRALDVSPLQFAAEVTETLKMMSVEQREKLLDYLIKGSTSEHLLDELIDNFKQDVLTNARPWKSLLTTTHQDEMARDLAEQLDIHLNKVRTQIVSMVNESTTVQRVPVVEYVMTIGDDKISGDASKMNDLLERHLGLVPGSVNHSSLRAYLDVIPRYEKELAISYFLLHGGEHGKGDDLDIVALFEAFGTVGKKFGQSAAAWNIFGDAYSKKLSELFSNARPMSKYEIETLLKQEWGEETYNKTVKRLVRILGGASIKTVVLVELMDGSHSALMVQPPEAKGQTLTNLDMAKKYIERLGHYSLQSNDPLFLPLVNSVEAQMPNELNFKIEIQNTREAQRQVRELSDQLTSKFDGWQMDVPNVNDKIHATQHVFGTEVAKGVPAKEYLEDPTVPQAEKDMVGEFMATVSLRMLFKYGSFDSDRHPGNFIVDRDHLRADGTPKGPDELRKPKIYFIDAGQLVSFDTSRSLFHVDDRLKLGQFLAVIQGTDGSQIVQRALEMVAPEKRAKVDIAVAARAVEDAIRTTKGEPPGVIVREIVRSLYANGCELDLKFTFGGLKGLMTLAGSNYVNPAKMAKILESEITRLYAKKIPAVIKTTLKEFL